MIRNQNKRITTRLETSPDEIFGIVDEVLDVMEKRERPPQKKPKPKKPRGVLPKLQVKRSTVPPELNKVDAGNVVYVPDSVLKALASTLDLETRVLNRVLLRELMPLLLSYQTSTTYTRAAIKEGLDVEIDFDAGLQDMVQHIGYLSVAMHFIRRSKLPISVRKRFMRRMSDLIADNAVRAMVEANKADDRRALMQELQAVVYSRQKNKAEVKTPEKPESQVKAVRKTRR